MVCVNRVVQIDVGFETTPARAEAIVALMAAGLDAEQLSRATGSSPEESNDLLDLLSAEGVLHAEPRHGYPTAGMPLVEAIMTAIAGDRPEGLVWAGSEALILPEALSPRLARRALRAFVAGLGDHSRLRAYGYAATTVRRTICGDAPDPRRLEEDERDARASAPEAIQVLD